MTDVVSTDGAWQWDPTDEMKNMRAFMTWEKPDLNAKVHVVPRGCWQDSEFLTQKDIWIITYRALSSTSGS